MSNMSKVNEKNTIIKEIIIKCHMWMKFKKKYHGFKKKNNFSFYILARITILGGINQNKWNKAEWFRILNEME